MKNFNIFLVTFGVIFCRNFASTQDIGILDIAENVDLYELTALLNTISQICNVIKNIEADDICFKQLTVVCQDERFLERMVDANSKFPYSGMLVKTRLDLGNYDECTTLDLTVKNIRVLGKHCTAGLIIPISNDSNALEDAYKLSTCIPNECTAMELLTFANLTEMYPLFNDYSCSTKESNKRLGWDDYLVIVFFASVLLLMITATIYDVYFFYNNTVCPHILLRAFSVLHNGQKLLKVSKTSNEDIKVIHGLRVFSMMWVVVAHVFSTMSSIPGTDVEFSSRFEGSRMSTYVTTAHLAVDTFFFVSGFLLPYHYLKGKPTSFLNHLRRIPWMIFHRYVRLTPVVASIFIIVITLFMHIGDGPIYESLAALEKDRCLKYWWSFFTYLQNYVNYEDMCILSTWYISADWQLFLISPIILIPVALLVKSNFKWIMGQLLFLNLIFTVLPIGLKLLLRDYDNFFETHGRLNAYFIGFMLGVYMRERNETKHRFSTISVIVIWICTLTTLVVTTLVFKEIQLLVYSHQDNSYSTYFILLRCFWCIALAWILYACQNGYGGFINWVLTTPLMQVLSKLTFCMYILHPCPLIYLRLTIRNPIEYTQLTAFKDSVVVYVATLFLSIGWTFAFESPLITIEKYFM